MERRGISMVNEIGDVKEVIEKIPSAEEEVDFNTIRESLTEAERAVVYESQMNHRPSFAEPSLARRGAVVISVEGETIQVGGHATTGIGTLGYLISIDNTAYPNTVRVRFSTLTDRNRMILESEHGNIERVVESPLSISGTDAINPHGFIVDRKNGLRILEDGDLVLVSRTGIFAGMNGWELARKMEERWREAEYTVGEIQEEYEKLVAEFDRKEREITDLKLDIADLQEKNIDYQKRLTEAYQKAEDVERILISYKTKMPSLAKQNERLMNENAEIIAKVLNAVETLKTSVLKFETVNLAYTMESKIPQELIESTEKGEKERLMEAGFIEEEEREADEERVESNKGSEQRTEGTGGKLAGGQTSEGENQEGAGFGGSPLPIEESHSPLSRLKKVVGFGGSDEENE